MQGSRANFLSEKPVSAANTQPFPDIYPSSLFNKEVLSYFNPIGFVITKNENHENDFFFIKRF